MKGKGILECALRVRHLLTGTLYYNLNGSNMASQYRYTVVDIMHDRVKPLLVPPFLRSCFYPHTPWTHAEAQSVKVRRGSNKVTGVVQ